MVEKIDLVYKIGQGCSMQNHGELRYSIRSAVRHFKDLGNIYIVGFKPNWLDASRIVHIPLIDCYESNKDANLINKLIAACIHRSVSHHFLNMSDDYFFLEDMAVEDFKVAFYNNEIVDTAIKKLTNGQQITKWERRVLATCNTLMQRGYKSNCYEVHSPVLIDSKVYPFTVLNYNYAFENGYCGNTLYYNSINAESKEIDKNRICRLLIKPLDFNELEQSLANKKLFNYTINSFSNIVERYLSDRFNVKSEFEI